MLSRYILLIAKGTDVWIRLYQHGVEIKALAKVVYSGSELGMGVIFTNVHRADQGILRLWTEELCDSLVQKQ